MEYVLGMDIGTGSVKAVAVNLLGQSLEVFQQHYGFNVPQPGYHEQDGEEIWQAFVFCFKGIIAKMGRQPLAVSLSSAMHSLIAVNENGEPLAPMITWADSRSSEIAKRLRASEEGIAIYVETGTPLHAMSPLCKIIWIKTYNEELFSKTHKFISIKEYIWYKLFNEFVVDHSIASCTGLFNLLKLDWHVNSLDLAGITAQQLSKAVPVEYTKTFNRIEGDTASNFLETGIPFIIGANDGCSANLGCIANKAGLAAMTIGTSGALRIASRRPLPNKESMTFSYILDKDTFICGGPINNGGIALQWLLKNNISAELSKADYTNLFQQISTIDAGSNGLTFLPYLTGERAPIWDSESCGVFFGVKLQHSQAHFSRAVVEGVCYAMRDVLEAVEQNSEPIDQVIISGGFAKSDPALDHADLQFGLMTVSAGSNGKDEDIALDPYPGITLLAYFTRPQSQGEVRIQSADPDAPLSVNMRHLSAEIDQKTFVAAFHWLRRMAAQPALKDWVIDEIYPAGLVKTDDDILANAMTLGGTCFHSAGTARMGADPRSVVDPQLRVRGVQGLPM